jgi:hypothetical protein
MRSQRLKPLFVAVFGIALTLTPNLSQAQGAADSRDDRDSRGSGKTADDARPIEGLWQSEVTIRVCQTGDAVVTFRAVNMFIRGGALSVTDDAPPTLRGPGFGQWYHAGGRRYTDGFRFNQFSPDGTFAGVFKVARKITLNHAADRFTSSVTADIFDANNNLVESVCATETSRRLD